MIAHNRPTIGEEESAAIAKVIDSGYIGSGPKVKEFEFSFGNFSGFKGENCVAVSSGSAALYLALKALGIGPSDEVIIPTYTCSAVLNAVNLALAKAVLVDVSPDDFNPTAEMILQKITSKTKAIVITHTFGSPFDVAKLKKRTKVAIIEDCAGALGTRIANKPIGLIGNIAVFSFYASKLMTTGYGGMICTKNSKIARELRDYRDFDCIRDYKPRFNFLLSDMASAMGIEQLKKLPKFLDARAQIAQAYDQAINERPWVCQKTEMKNCTLNNYRFVIKLSSRAKRDKLRAYFLANEVKTIVPIEDWELLHNYLKMNPKDFTNAEFLGQTTLSLPIYPELFISRKYKMVAQLLKDFDER